MADPSAQASAISAQAQLNSIGFDVTIDNTGGVTDVIRKQFIKHDFDVVRGSSQMIDEAPYLHLYSALGSDSFDNSSGSNDKEMDQLLSDLQRSLTDDDKRETMDKILTMSMRSPRRSPNTEEPCWLRHAPNSAISICCSAPIRMGCALS